MIASQALFAILSGDWTNTKILSDIRMNIQIKCNIGILYFSVFCHISATLSFFSVVGILFQHFSHLEQKKSKHHLIYTVHTIWIPNCKLKKNLFVLSHLIENKDNFVPTKMLIYSLFFFGCFCFKLFGKSI